MNINFTINEKHGLNKKEVKIILNTLNQLKSKYKDVVIESIGDFYTKNKLDYVNMRNTFLEVYSEKECEKLLQKLNIVEPTFDINMKNKKYSDDDSCGYYKDNSIYINHAKDKVLFIDYSKQRKRQLTLIEKRKKIDPRLLKYIKLDNPGDVLECAVWHEFGHALAYKYNLNENNEILKLFKSLTKEDINIELNEYASRNIDEFIACCFQESMFEDARAIATTVKRIIDKVCLIK